MKYAIPCLLCAFMLAACGQQEAEETALPTEMDHGDMGLIDDMETVLAVEEYDVPWDEGRSRDPYVAPNGDVFFAGQQSHYVGKFDPQTQEFTRFDLPDGAGPHTVVSDPNGMIWYAGNRDRHLGMLNPETGEITRYDMESDLLRDPHTIAFNDEGNFWFTAQGGNGIGFFNVETGETTVIEVPTPNARPYGIRMAPDGMRPWIALFGTNKIATVDPETMELEEIVLPRDEIRPRRLDVVSNGTVWYGDFSSGYIGRYNPEDGSITEWEMPDGDASRPYAVLADEFDRIWLSASGLSPNKLVAFDTNHEEFVTAVEIESGQGSIRHMMYDDRTNSLWFGTDTGHIGRLVVN